MTFGEFPCPNCKVGRVIRQKPKGALPHCAACLAKSVKGRLARQQEARANGYDAHRDDNGKRYGEGLSKCSYCQEDFINHRRGAHQKYCDTCIPRHREVLAERRYRRKTSDAYIQKERRRMRTYRLTAMGLTWEWFEQQPQRCGICETTDPGRKAWCIDHDHSCCEFGCAKCVRGLLCHLCNIGLGSFKDDPKRLQAAIAWVSRGVSS